MHILILAPYAPYPPHGGGTMRIYQIVRGLAQHHTVTCLTFAADTATEAALAPLHTICRVLVVRGPATRSTLRRALDTGLSPLPDMAHRNASPAYTAALHALLAAERVDVVLAESIEMAPYLDLVRVAQPNARIALDEFNAEYLLQQRAASIAVRTGLRARAAVGAVYSLAQAAKLAAFERGALRRADTVFVVSDADRTALQRVSGRSDLVVAPNGVDTTYFDRTRVIPLTYAAPTLVFSGTLDYRPNVDALTWFAGEPLARLRAVRPDLLLLAVGKRPAPAIQALAARGVLQITGEVADTRNFLAGGAVYLVPMRIGGGVRLKLLEALSMALPVVSTTLGAEGIAGLRDGEHCLLADDPAGMATAVLRLLDDPVLAARLGAAGRALVVAHYDWRTIVPIMARALAG